MDASFWTWLIGAICGAFVTVAIGGWRLGSAFTKINDTLKTLNDTLIRLQDEHDEHEDENKEQISTLWKRQDEIRDRVTILEQKVMHHRRSDP